MNISNTPVNVVNKPAITVAHVGDTEVVLNEEYDDYELSGLEWASTNAERAPATCQDMQSFSWRAKSLRLTRVTILFSISPQLAIQLRGFSNPEATSPVSPLPPLATAPSPPSSPTPLRSRSKLSSPLQSGNLGVKAHHLFLLLSTKTLSRISILWQKIGVTPRVSRIPSVLGAFDSEAPTFGRSFVALTMS